MDQQRQALRKEAEEEERKIREEESKLQEAKEQATQAKRMRVSQPEPEKTHPDRRQIVIRTPSGKRFSRTFTGDDEVEFVYDWIDVTCTDEPFAKDSYRLVSRLPGAPN